MNNSLPYKVGYADGGKVCGKCSKMICAGRLELAIMMQVIHQRNTAKMCFIPFD